MSAALCALLMSLRSDVNFSSVVRCTMAAVGGSVGASALTLAVLPALLQKRAYGQADVARYAAVTSLPLAASGWTVALPSLTLSYVAIALLCALAYRSGMIGARVVLGQTGIENARISALTCLVAALPSLLVAPLCAVR